MSDGAERATASWQRETARSLAERWGVPEVHLFSRVGSTNDVARRLAERGAPTGTTVVAEEQVTGRGRAGRAWSSPPGLGLWLSMVARPARSAVGTLPILTGLATADALDPLLPDGTLRIKWPNDLLLDDRKVGGILCEGAWTGGVLADVVVGVGLNVLHGPDDFPEEIRERATSLRIAGAEGVTLLEAASRLVPALRLRLGGGGELDADMLADLRDRDALRDRRVRVTDPATGAELVRGVAAGIAPGGELLVRDDAGQIRPLHSGTVRTDNDPYGAP